MNMLKPDFVTRYGALNKDVAFDSPPLQLFSLVCAALPANVVPRGQQLRGIPDT
jgi:hypothetical protein